MERGKGERESSRRRRGRSEGETSGGCSLRPGEATPGRFPQVARRAGKGPHKSRKLPRLQSTPNTPNRSGAATRLACPLQKQPRSRPDKDRAVRGTSLAEARLRKPSRNPKVRKKYCRRWLGALAGIMICSMRRLMAWTATWQSQSRFCKSREQSNHLASALGCKQTSHTAYIEPRAGLSWHTNIGELQNPI